MSPVQLPPSVVGPQAADKATQDQQAVKRAAREFETVFLRKILSALGKTSQIAGKGGGGGAGGDIYGSMVVGAMADAVSSGGGLGLADVITRSLIHPGDATPPPTAPRQENGEAPLKVRQEMSFSGPRREDRASSPSGTQGIGLLKPDSVRRTP